MIRINIRKKLNIPGGITELVINNELELNKITALYGKSGAGKTSLLKIIAGLMQPEQGYIDVNGKIWLDTATKINLPPQQRDIGFVFQDYALFPNMTVKQNLEYALGKQPDKQIITDLLNLTGLSDFAGHKPATLSGGQKQRAALARALVRKPSLLLLDEPLSAIDTETRQELQHQLLRLHNQYRFTALLVSHDVDELFKLANKVICIHNGTITQSGTPADIFATKRADNELDLQGVVIALNGNDISVLINRQILVLKNTGKHSIGDQIEMKFGQIVT